MQRSDYLRRLGQTGTASLLTAMLAASVAHADLPTGGMLLPRPRGPARSDLPSATSIGAVRTPSETAYGLAGERRAPSRIDHFDDANSYSLEVVDAPAGSVPKSRLVESIPAGTSEQMTAGGHPLIRPRTSYSDAQQAFAVEPAASGSDVAIHARTAANSLPEGLEDQSLTGASSESSYAGLKGICPVTLRDERRVVTPQPEIFLEYGGRRYEFATVQAKAAFEANPDKYAPVLGGRDVVLTASGAEDAIGSLKHAGFYRERLYLFQSDDTCKTFYENPRRYHVGE